MSNIENVRKEFQKDFVSVTTQKDLEKIWEKYLSKKGELSKLMGLIKEVEDKKQYGQDVNTLKLELTSQYKEKETEILKIELDKELKSRAIDVTLPGEVRLVAHRNILLQTKRQIEDIFCAQGYQIATGQEVESEYYNFDALNFPKDHPAKDMQDTLYINKEFLLRTHTSNMQSRILEANPNQEIKIICPGKVYRRDDDDATHSHQFMQVEGLYVTKKDNQAKPANLKALKEELTLFVRKVFEDELIELRLRPSFFPFTEPSVEVDMTCTNCQKAGCSICKQTGWIEILGAGIVHENILKLSGFDTKEYTGYAFGIGVERIAMIKYGIKDIRMMYQNDYRFLKQF